MDHGTALKQRQLRQIETEFKVIKVRFDWVLDSFGHTVFYHVLSDFWLPLFQRYMRYVQSAKVGPVDCTW